MRTRGAIAAGVLFAALVVGAASLDPLRPSVAIADEAGDLDGLVARLLGDDPNSAAGAVDALVARGVAAIPRLSVTDAPVAKRVVLLETLGRIAAEHDEGVAALVTALGDKEAAVRAAAARGLAIAGPRAKTAGATLRPLLNDSSGVVRVAAAAAMIASGFSGPKGFAWQPLVNAVRDPDPVVRAAAIRALLLARVPSDLTLPPILAGTQDDDGGVRMESLRAIAATDSKDARIVVALARCGSSPVAAERALAQSLIPKFTDRPVLDVIRFGGAFRGDRLERRASRSDPDIKKVDAAVTAALDWLARHQSKDGHWSCKDFDGACKENRCDGPGDAAHDVGVTGLALLAFLGAGETSSRGPHRESVTRGFAFLISGIDSEGCVGPRTSSHFVYDHAVATVALCEAAMLDNDPEMTEAASRAVSFVLKAKNPYLAWRYNYPPDGDNDTSVTGWMTYALATANAIGIGSKDSKEAVGDAMNWVRMMTDPEYGRTGYQQRGGPSSRQTDMLGKFPSDKVEGMTSIGIMVRLFAGHQRSDDEFIDSGGRLLGKKLPEWDQDAGKIDFYYWFWGSMAARQIGGDVWSRWSAALKTALLKGQRGEHDRCERGSWDPIDAWSATGGRVYSTAMCCMALESYWRMDPLMTPK